MVFPYKIIDLTHPLTSEIPTWDGLCGFNHRLKKAQQDSNETPFFLGSLEMQAGIGTHMDAPAHCVEGGLFVDQIPLDSLSAPVFVIDISDRATENYQLSVQDILNFETQFGDIAPDSFVIMRSGWDRFWVEPEKYRNHSNFPSISKEAAQILLDRFIVGIGVDTLSPDTGKQGFPVHDIFLGAGKYLVENIANSQSLPNIGAHILVLPLKIQGGTEAPLRLVGLLEKEDVSLERMETILDLEEGIGPREKELSLRLFELLKGKKVMAVRLLSNPKKELLIEFEGGNRLFVDNFNDFLDVSVT